jgi:hypothetical protein
MNRSSTEYLLSDRAGHWLCLGVTILSLINERLNERNDYGETNKIHAEENTEYS